MSDHTDTPRDVPIGAPTPWVSNTPHDVDPFQTANSNFPDFRLDPAIVSRDDRTYFEHFIS